MLPSRWRRACVRSAFLLSAFAALASAGPLSAADWVHWRGPEENGVSREKGLPDGFEPTKGAAGNVAWKQPYGGRSAPLVMDGRIYVIQGVGEGLHEGERVVCLDEKTGKFLWDYRVNVFLTDIVSARLGWTTLTADPATGYVYAHTTAGYLLCLDKAGKVVWKHSLTEEYGRVTGYGGRIVSPIFDSGLVIVGMVNGSWGDQARGSNRFVAFDGKTGNVVWWASPTEQVTQDPRSLKGTYYSSPVVTVIGGQRLLITGAADGYLHALKVRTGERAWSYQFSAGVVNGSPVVDGNLVYCAHGEENPEGGPIGRIICVDASQVDPKTKKPKLVWEYRKAHRFGLASPALADGRLYIPDDTGDLYCFNGKTGKFLWKYRYATEVRGAPLVADGKLYIFDVKSRFLILQLKGDEAPDEGDTFEYKFRDPKGLLAETNGTPIAVNGRVYFATRTDLWALADSKAKPEAGSYKKLPAEAAGDAPAGVRIYPADAVGRPGEKIEFKLVFVDANGREVAAKDAAAEWSLPAPPTPKGATSGPPPLQGKVEGDVKGAVVTLAAIPNQQGYVEVKAGTFTARARVRVAPQVPYKIDFEKVPDGATPGGWVNVQGKFFVTTKNGQKVLAKVNTDSRPPLARANAYITLPDAASYVIEADLMGTQVRGRMPDMGLVNSRYTLILDGKTDPTSGKREVRLVSWEARPRINVAVDFDWQPGEWYTAKLEVVHAEKTATIRGKVWKKGDKEPEKWTVEFEDPGPNREGAAAVYGYVPDPQINPENPGSEIFYDNITITPVKK